MVELDVLDPLRLAVFIVFILVERSFVCQAELQIIFAEADLKWTHQTDQLIHIALLPIARIKP